VHDPLGDPLAVEVGQLLEQLPVLQQQRAARAGGLRSSGCRRRAERRQYFGETDATVAKRIDAALGANLTPIVCIGETLEEREAGRTEQVLATQLDGGLANLSAETFAKLLIAYEPVWAIGTGKTATPEMAADAHRFVRRQIAEKLGAEAAAGVRILYGGSVKPNNVKGLMEREDIDGGLVGGASLDPESFAAIVNFDR
jgi:triosephosphate isomerase (TIM)